MMYLLYPQLPKPTADLMVEERAGLEIEELREMSNDLDHPDVEYTPTGGTRIDSKSLRSLQESVRRKASEYGYPDRSTNSERHEFDKQCSIALYENMYLHPSEASRIEIWIYIALILLPDIVRWRFPSSSGTTSTERFIGSSRGLRRNMFGRLWWRSHLFHLPEHKDDPYILLSALTEDEIVQITERPSLAGSPELAKLVARAFLIKWRDADRAKLDIERRALMRDGIKRMSRLLSFTMLDLLDREQAKSVIMQVFSDSVTYLSRQLEQPQ